MNRGASLASFAAVLCLVTNACDREQAADPSRLVQGEFDGRKAFAHVQKLVSLGPRPSGSQAIEQSRQYMEQVLQSLGWSTLRQAFTDRTPRGDMRFVNLRARFGAVDWNAAKPILLGSHYDTKILDFAFVGANDGGSSTGALLEIARVTALNPTLAEKLELVFFDGEEAILHSINEVDGLYGSRYYARQIRKGPKPQFGVILDMIGDRQLNIGLPTDSPPGLRDWLLKSAEELGSKQFFGSASGQILDDHVALNEIGVPTIDVIDLDFGPWHTQDDTMDKISPESLQIVSRAVLHMLEKYVAPGVH